MKHITKKDLIDHIEGWSLNMVERWDYRSEDLIQEYLDVETYLEENYEKVVKHYKENNYGEVNI